MKILYIGDVMGEVGLAVVERVLPKLRDSLSFDVVIAQAENVSEGRGTMIIDFTRLRKAGVDFCSGGNWTLYQKEIVPLLNDPDQPIIRPLNLPFDTPGLGAKYLKTQSGEVLIISLLGRVVGKDSDKPIDNPLKAIDKILNSESGVSRLATVVNFHGDYSSEKVVIGHYLDGRVSAVVGDHWHVPTADARVLPGGTAHITDVGMCGVLDASLGVSYQSVIPRWRDGTQTRNVLEAAGPRQFNAVLIDVNQAGHANSIASIREIL